MPLTSEQKQPYLNIIKDAGIMGARYDAAMGTLANPNLSIDQINAKLSQLTGQNVVALLNPAPVVDNSATLAADYNKKLADMSKAFQAKFDEALKKMPVPEAPTAPDAPVNSDLALNSVSVDAGGKVVYQCISKNGGETFTSIAPITKPYNTQQGFNQAQVDCIKFVKAHEADGIFMSENGMLSGCDSYTFAEAAAYCTAYTV